MTGSGLLGISIGLNAVSTHGTCTAVFVAIAAVFGFLTSSVRTLGKITWLAWVGLPCIIIAGTYPQQSSKNQKHSNTLTVIIVTAGVGVQDRPADAPTDAPWVPDWKVVNNPSFTQAITAICNLVFAFSGTPGFFSIVSEMRNPRQYTSALLICQATVTTVYAIIGCLIYYYCGSYVASPALGSAGGLVKKICYGIALPGLIVTTTIVSHVRPPNPYNLTR